MKNDLICLPIGFWCRIKLNRKKWLKKSLTGVWTHDFMVTATKKLHFTPPRHLVAKLTLKKVKNWKSEQKLCKPLNDIYGQFWLSFGHLSSKCDIVYYFIWLKLSHSYLSIFRPNSQMNWNLLASDLPQFILNMKRS